MYHNSIYAVFLPNFSLNCDKGSKRTYIKREYLFSLYCCRNVFDAKSWEWPKQKWMFQNDIIIVSDQILVSSLSMSIKPRSEKWDADFLAYHYVWKISSWDIFFSLHLGIDTSKATNHLDIPFPVSHQQLHCIYIDPISALSAFTVIVYPTLSNRCRTLHLHWSFLTQETQR